MTDIDEIRRKRMQQMQQQAAQQSSEAESQEHMRREMETQKKIELQLIQLAQAGRVQSKISDDQLKELLRKLIGQKREIKISRSY